MRWLLRLVHLGLWTTLLANLGYLWRGARRTGARAETSAHGPALSVLIPARNEARNLRRLLPSLLRQDHPSFEVVVYDDGSEDGTWGVLQGAAHDDRLQVLRGDGPPPGWVGKVHALYQATREARGRRYLFLDADARLDHPAALRRVEARFDALPPRSVLTALPRLRGGAKLLVSLVPNAILTGLPWPLVRPLRTGLLGALNGQCWMIEADAYHRHEPHRHHSSEVLEDVQIGRYLKRKGLTPVLCDLQDNVSVFMYDDLPSAWRGFRKNAYLILGGHPAPFALLFPLFALTFVLAPAFDRRLALSILGLKAATDRRTGFPWWVTAATPLSYVLAVALQLDSAVAHWTGRVDWKGRRVGDGRTPALGSRPSPQADGGRS